MTNSVEDLIIVKNLNVSIKPPKAPRIVEVNWFFSPLGWIKVNTDDAIFGNPGLASSAGIFYTSRGLIKGCFAIPIGIGFVFEAELTAAIYVISFAWEKDCHVLWLETNSSYLVAVLRNRSLVVHWHWHPTWICCLEYISKM